MDRRRVSSIRSGSYASFMPPFIFCQLSENTVKKLPAIFEKCPNVWRLKDLIITANELSTEIEKGKWVQARPMGAFGFRHRCRAAWLVFTGRADAVTWPNNQ